MSEQNDQQHRKKEEKLNMIAKQLLGKLQSDRDIQKYLKDTFPRNPTERKHILEKVRLLRRENQLHSDIQAGRFSKKDRLSAIEAKKLEERDQEIFKAMAGIIAARNERIKELYNYFRKVGHTGGIPPDFFTEADTEENQSRIITSAAEDFDTYFDFLQRLKGAKGYKKLEPGQVPIEGIHKEDQPFLDDANEDFSGKRPIKRVETRTKVAPTEVKTTAKEHPKPADKVTPKLAKLKQKTWYRKQDLSEDDINLLVQNGYQVTDKSHPVYDFNHRLVSCLAFKQGGFNHKSYRNDKRETINHYSRPFLLQELIPTTQPLVPINNGERIIDAVIDTGKAKIAIEFQESHSLDSNRIREKLRPLLNQFNYVVIVCSEQHKKIYEVVQDSKLKVFNNAEFANYVASLRSQIKV